MQYHILKFGVWECAQCQKSFVNYILKWCEMISPILTSTEGFECWFDGHLTITLQFWWRNHLKFAHGVCNCLHELPVICVFHGQLIDSERWSLHVWHFQACELRALSCPNSTWTTMVHRMKTNHVADFFVNILVARPSLLNMLLVESRPWNCFFELHVRQTLLLWVTNFGE